MSETRSLFGDVPDPTPAPLAAALYVDLVFDRPLETPYTYAVPDELVSEVAIGKRILAPLGSKPDRGWCVAIRPEAPSRPCKAIVRVLDPEPLVNSHLLELTRWMAHYYLCGWGQVLQAIVPAGVRRRAEAPPRRASWLVPTPIADLPAVPPKLTARQQEALDHLRAIPAGLETSQLLKEVGCSSSVVDALVERGFASKTSKPEGDIPDLEQAGRAPSLTPEQTTVLNLLEPALTGNAFAPFLLLGVTGSGKTEVYMSAIEKVVARGRQALVLVPEISLTPQTEARFAARFTSVSVLHSHLGESERQNRWRRVAAGRAQVIIGARSAVFAPAPNLGLIVVDEEHEPSFKQESTPRYHGRDVAVMRASLLGIPVVLGSATPSLETWFNASRGIYTRLDLTKRVENRPLPKVEVLDMRHPPARVPPGRALSDPLIAALRHTIRNEGQAILFLNRRGYSPFIVCPSCGETAKCRFCDLALTFHRTREVLLCHHCGFQTPPLEECPSCRKATVRYQGLGTEKVHEELERHLPGAVIRRMDSDTMSKPGSHALTLEAFRNRMVQVLLGTQMVAKGLDFPGVTLVGVIQADAGLHMPDFRAAERTFQLLTQVAGRCGRGDKPGRVIVQTLNPEHEAVALAAHHNYFAFTKGEMEQREVLGYPPYQRIIRIIIRAHDEKAADDYAARFAGACRLAHESTTPKKTMRLLGPAVAPVSRLNDYHRRHILILSADSRHLHAVARAALASCRPDGGAEIAIDVDPGSMM